MLWQHIWSTWSNITDMLGRFGYTSDLHSNIIANTPFWALCSSIPLSKMVPALRLMAQKIAMVIRNQQTLQLFSSDHYYESCSTFSPPGWDPQIGFRPALSYTARRVCEIQRRMGAQNFPYVVRIQQSLQLLLYVGQAVREVQGKTSAHFWKSEIWGWSLWPQMFKALVR